MNYAEFMKTIRSSIRATFAYNVKIYRNTLGYTQEKLAEKTRLSVQTIKDIEGGRRWVSDSTLTRLAKALSIAEFQLLLPEKSEKPREKSSLKTLIALKKELKTFLDTKFENAVNTGDFS